jgi:hypothetical protein
MTKKTLRKYTLFPVSILLMAAGIMLACIDVEVSPYPNSFFAPEITHNNKCYEFFRSYYPLYQESYKSSYTDDFNAINLNEWNGYFKKAVDEKDLSYLLYTARLGEIDTLIYTLKKPGYLITARLKANSIMRVADTRLALDFLYYIGFAKRCEIYSTYQPDWSDRTSPTLPLSHKEDVAKLEKGGIKQIGNANSDFVRQRYAFQVLRLYFMATDYDTCIQFYANQKNLLQATNNSITYRAMGYLAGACNKKGDIVTANYLYSVIYGQSDYLKEACHFSFKPQEEKDFAQTLAMARNTREKTVLWQMLGVSHDPFRAMKEIYALDPKSDMLDLLLTRAVNIEEEKFLNQDDLNEETPDASISEIDADTINTNLVSFIRSVADKGNTAKPYEWDLAAGYLDWAAGNNDFQKYLDKTKTEAAKNNAINSLAQDEVRLILLLDKLKHGKAGDKSFEDGIVPELKWLAETNHDTAFRRGFAYAFVMDELSNKYAANGNKVLAACFKHDLPYNGSINSPLLGSVIALMDKDNKTPLESYALSEFHYTRVDLVEMQAVDLLYHYKLDDALAKLNEDKEAGKELLEADPFIIHINDNHDSDAALKNKTLYTKKQFIQKMIELEKKASKNSKASAQDYFMLANGYYNMSYFGNSRILYETKATHMSEAGFDYGGFSDTGSIYMSCQKAQDCYDKAMNLATDPEFKAQCCFMAAKCEQNYFFCHKPKDYKGDFKAGKYFADLKDLYLNTQYYQEAIKECGYFATYTATKREPQKNSH